MLNGLKKFQKIAGEYEGIMFTGKNGKDIAELARSWGFDAKAGGSYVDVGLYVVTGETPRLKKGDWLLFDDQTQDLVIMHDINLKKNFQPIKKPRGSRTKK